MLGLFAVMAKPRAIFFERTSSGPCFGSRSSCSSSSRGPASSSSPAGFVVTGALVSIYTVFLVQDDPAARPPGTVQLDEP